MTLSAAEAEQFQSLESFYQQIGALTELRMLDLRAVHFNPLDNCVVSGNFRYNSFPGMLSLGNETTGGRPRYLQLLGGLSKMRTLIGSFSCSTEEAKAMIGMDEVAWMERHWPALENAQCFFYKSEIPSHFQWWLEQRAGRRFSIKIKR